MATTEKGKTKETQAREEERQARVRERLLLSEGPPVTQREILETVKVIRDETRNFVSHEVKSLQGRLQILDQGLASRFGEELDRHTKNLRDELERQEKALRDYYGERLDSQTKEFGGRLFSLE